YRISRIGSPERLAGWLADLRQELLRGLQLVQFREPDWQGDPASLREAFLAVLALCRQQGARCLVNSQHPAAWWPEADGVQLRAADAARILQDDTRPPGWLGVSAHTAEDIACARQLQADFVVLGHALDTDSHPGLPAL